MSKAKLTVFLSDRWRRLLLRGRLSFCNSFKSEILMVLVLSSVDCVCGCGCGCGCDGCCTCMVLVLRPDRMLEMSVGPRMSGRLETEMDALALALALVAVLRVAFKSGRLEGMGAAAVLFPARNGVPASEVGSRTLVGTGGGGGRWFGM